MNLRTNWPFIWPSFNKILIDFHTEYVVGKETALGQNYRVIHKSAKHLKNSQQMDYATDHGNSYVDREKNSPSFFKENPAHIVALICR